MGPRNLPGDARPCLNATPNVGHPAGSVKARLNCTFSNFTPHRTPHPPAPPVCAHPRFDTPFRHLTFPSESSPMPLGLACIAWTSWIDVDDADEAIGALELPI